MVIRLLGPAVEESPHLSVAPRASERSVTTGEKEAVDAIEDLTEEVKLCSASVIKTFL